MKTSIERTSNGAVVFLYGEDETPVGYANLENVQVKAVIVPIGRPIVKTPAIQISVPTSTASQTIIFSDLININGAPKPTNINQAVLLLINEVFNG